MKRTMISLIACLTLASCGASQFCQVVKAPLIFAPETARQMVRTDRPDVERIAVQNEFGARHCDW